MTFARGYRYINNICEEGFIFYLLKQYIAHFYLNIMGCKSRRDGPDSLIKYSRDFEYTWVVIKSDIKPDYKVLDCGSGYLPIPFIWSKFGAEACALDKEDIICSRL